VRAARALDRSQEVPKKRLTQPLLWLLVLMSLGACGLGAIPIPDATPTPCPSNCPPPTRDNGQAHIINDSFFQLTYFDPWSVDSSGSSNNTVTLVASTQLGDVTIQIHGQRVSSGTSADALLNNTVRNILDNNNFTDARDFGPIKGAEIGYVSGAGQSIGAYASQGNAPQVPVFVQVMASVQNSTGIIFVAISPLDPNSPDPSIVPNEEYDHVVNSVVWR
jgi:hypothetical protein